MLFTIHRYIFRDLLKVFLLTSLVLGLVMGLGVMLRPLRQFSIDPLRVPELVFCTLPVTMTMVLPIAALLAATLIYGRLAVDNEINACRSSGIGLYSLIYPAFVLALLVGLATLLLSFHVIPRFVARSERIIKSDAEAIIYRNIEKKGNLGEMFRDIQIHADQADPQNHRLMGVVVMRLNLTGFDWVVTARQVKLEMLEQAETSKIRLLLDDVMMMDAENNTWSGKRLPFTMDVPRLLRDDIKFKNLDQLKAIQNDMGLFYLVREKLEELRYQYLIEHFFERCDEQLAQPRWCDWKRKECHFINLFKGQNGLRIYARQCRLKPSKKTTAEFVTEGGGPVEVAFFREGGNRPEKIYRAESTRLRVAQSPATPAGRLVLEKVRWSYLNEADAVHLEEYDFGGIGIEPEVIRDADRLTLEKEVLPGRIPLERAAPSLTLQGLYTDLQAVCRMLSAEIQAEKHSRLAFGVSCVVLVLMGAALGILFRSGHLLTAFGVSFVPAALCLITIFTGKHIAEQNPDNILGGVVFLWSGILLVGAANVIIYKRLFKR